MDGDKLEPVLAECDALSDALLLFDQVSQAYLQAGDPASYIAILTRMVELDPDHVGNRIDRHAVLQPDDNRVVVEQWLDEFGHPASVVRLDGGKDNVERLSQLGDLTQVIRRDWCDLGFGGQVNGETVGSHCLDVGRPLFDEGNVKAGANHVGSDVNHSGTISVSLWISMTTLMPMPCLAMARSTTTSCISGIHHLHRHNTQE
jgi:hypothetical protein